ncbi:MAG: adenylate/guanylate cyclase domain-containing protein [Acidimicrobiales bacterium]
MAETGADLRAEVTRRIALATVGANVVGAVLVYLYLQFLAPGALTTTRVSDQFVVSAAAFPLYLLSTVLLVLRRLRSGPGGWAKAIEEGRPLTPAQRRGALRLPGDVALHTAVAWAGAAVLYGVINVAYGNPAASTVRTSVGIAIGGVVSTALTYLLAERRFRPVMVLALAGEPDERRSVGIRGRLLTAWFVGSATPLATVAATPLLHTRNGVVSLSVSIVSLAAIGLVAGFVLTSATAVSVSEPLAGVRRALEAVRRGELGVEIAVDDRGELGTLQADVNRMVTGLRERRRLEELFGRHVGEAVARQAIGEEAVLGGRLRNVSALFVDLIGSTSLAASRPPDEVVTVLNRLFGAVVEVVSAEGGWVNKFEGDGALCVFGAPEELPDHATRALRAARRLQARLAEARRDEPALDAAVGVASGPAVAGNVGASDRYEYTIIGDPVNEAARLSELAKAAPGRVLASDRIVAEADGEEAAAWTPRHEVVLRGRAGPTRLMAPDAAGARRRVEAQPPATAGTIDTV